MDDLRSIARRRPPPAWTVPAVLSTVRTPLKAANWARHLSSNPVLEFMAFLLCGIQEGFRVGFDYGRVVLKPSKSNMVSEREHPAIVSEYLQEECKKGRVIGNRQSARDSPPPPPPPPPAGNPTRPAICGTTGGVSTRTAVTGMCPGLRCRGDHRAPGCNTSVAVSAREHPPRL